jgi:hypothetical protein
VHGALIANKVNLLRAPNNSSNSVSSIISNPQSCEDPNTYKGGEQICLSPLYWVGDYTQSTETSTKNIEYIQQLPPTL